MKIALVNSFILNGGDAGIVFGTIDAIHSFLPDSKIFVFVFHTPVARRLYPDLLLEPMVQDTWPANRYLSFLVRKTFPFRRKGNVLLPGERNFFQKLSTMDAIVYCGGGYINDMYSTDVLFGIMKHTLKTGIPHFACGHSLGPFFKHSTTRNLSQLLNCFEAITVRDQLSLDLLHQLDVEKTKSTFTADAAFAMSTTDAADLPEADTREIVRIQNFKNKKQSRPLLFLSVRKWKFPGVKNSESSIKRYKAELCSFIERILSKSSWRICLVSTCQSRPGYTYDDAEFARSLINDVTGRAKDRLYICSHAFHPRSYPSLISQCADLVVAMRMHFMIFSILASTPVIGLAYEQKTVELARQIGIDNYCHVLHNFNSHNLWQTFLTIQKKQNEITQIIQRSCRHLQTRSLQNAEILKQVLIP